MIYYIYGEDSLIKKEIDSILKKEKNFALSKYDLENTSILKVIEDINTLDLFSNKKVLIVSNLQKIDNEEVLIKYINNLNDNILILVDQSIDNRKTYIKKIKELGKVIDTANTNLNDYIKEELKDYNISNLTINLLKDYCNNNFYRVLNEIEKLKMFKLEEKEITSDDVKLLVKKSLDKNVFDLVDAINRKDKKRIFNIYYELLNQGEDEMKVLSILASNFRILYKVKILLQEKKDEECISILNMHPYRFKLLKQEAFKYSEQELLKYLKDLSDIDISIKSGIMDSKTSIELFLSKI